jgi:hypothetical protein
MAKGRTVGAKLVTHEDRIALEVCKALSQLFLDSVQGEENKRMLKSEFAKVSTETRDAGAGLGAGKWQRDAITTRGVTNKAPFSNRNLRWHPLVAATKAPKWARPIEAIGIDVINGEKVLVFRIEEKNGAKKDFLPEETYLLPEKYSVLTEHWEPHKEILRDWNDDDWTRNSCVIKAEEACTWQDAVETYAILGISILFSKFGCSIVELTLEAKQVIQNFPSYDSNIKISDKFPMDLDSLKHCPVCRNDLKDSLSRFRSSDRSNTWQPNWGKSKRSEGEDDSLQVMHVNPLIQSEMRHNASNVRYGHRWCNIAMTDHTLEETLNFMKEILDNHGK